jgi:hypothetical protein
VPTAVALTPALLVDVPVTGLVVEDRVGVDEVDDAEELVLPAIGVSRLVPPFPTTDVALEPALDVTSPVPVDGSVPPLTPAG